MTYDERYSLVRRTTRGSLVAVKRESNMAYLEVTNFEDMNEISSLLNAAGIQRTTTRKEETYIPREKRYGFAWVVEFDYSELEKVMGGLSFLEEEPVQEIGGNPASRFDDIELGTHCAKCGEPIIRGATPYSKVGDEYYHEWCSEKDQFGTCYQDAWRFLAKQDEGFLVHGSTKLSAEAPRVNHAWVELTTGWIWEPQTGQYFTIEDFRIMSPEEHHKYTSEEAAIVIARTSNMGPWTDEERAEHLGR